MIKRAAAKVLKATAVVTAVLALGALLALVIRMVSRPSPSSAEGILMRADQLAWNNNWLAAYPLYIKAEQLFQRKGHPGRALYAHVSQIPVRMESADLSILIAELNRDLQSPAARQPEIRLRILEMKAKCEEEYDAGIAIQTFAQVEELAIRQHKLYLASRASGEQGILAFTLGNLADASSRVKRAYVVAKYLGDPGAHVRYAEMIGLGIEQLGRPKQALTFLNEAIDAQKHHPDVALPYVAYNAKIDALADLGRYADALALADAALIYPRKHQFYGQLESLLTSRADVLAKAGRNGDAIAEYEEALADAEKLQSWRAINNIDGKLAGIYERLGALPKALSAIDEAIEANKHAPQELFLVPGNLAFKARIETELGHRAVAERLYIKGADVLDALLIHVPTPETERLLLTELSDLYSGFFQLLSDEGRYGDAFDIIEQAHGRIEAQELEYNRIAVPRFPTREDLQLRQVVLKLANSDDRRARLDILRQLKPPQDARTVMSAEKTASLESVQGGLRPDELLIEYVLADPRSYALAISGSKTVRYVLPAKKQIQTDVAEYRNRVRKHGTDVYAGQHLFQELLGFASNFPASKSLIIVADGDLHLLPFSALVDKAGKYLIETKSVSVAPSGTVLSLLRNRVENATLSRPYLGVAPWTDKENVKPWVLRAVSLGSKDESLPALPESRDEVESIAAMMPRPSTVLIGPEATKEKFESLPLRDYRVLHLALHGLVDPVFPDRSALVFAPSKEDDGRLEARDIRRLHLNADLVTLSACDTAVGPVGAAGIESLDTAFIEAGANSVVSTLWESEDKSSDELMKDFYEHLTHESKTDALRDAKVDLLHSGAAPYYWASYELVGDPTGTPIATR